MCHPNIESATTLSDFIVLTDFTLYWTNNGAILLLLARELILYIDYKRYGFLKKYRQNMLYSAMLRYIIIRVYFCVFFILYLSVSISSPFL